MDGASDRIDYNLPGFAGPATPDSLFRVPEPENEVGSDSDER